MPNLYPALERQEVVVHSPEHLRSFAELSQRQLQAVAEAWQQRAGVAEREGFPYTQSIINEGREAGASLPHSHSQLVWLREPPPQVAAEQPQLIDGACALCGVLAEQRPDGPLLVDERGGVTMLAAPAGRAPYELLIAGEHGVRGFDHAFLLAALGLIREGLRRLHIVEGPVPWNAWLHDGAHPHFEVVPRLAVFAGLELGAGIYVNALAPEDAAARLRG